MKHASNLEPVHAVVPVNVLNKSKARLSSILTPTERRNLTVAMLKDVLAALTSSRRVRRVTVVSADKGAEPIARRYEATFLWEGRRRGLNKGVKLAIRNAERNGAQGVLVVHADLPLLRPHEIDTFVERSRSYPVAIVPSKDGRGTNALPVKPPQLLRPVVGKDSFRRHLSIIRKRKLRSKVLRFRGMSFDVDIPKDLIQLAERPPRNDTGRFLLTLRRQS